MKFSVGLVPLFLASQALAGFSLFGEQEPLKALANPVPGDSPLEYCSPDRSEDILTIESVDLTPNPPAAGSALIIQAVGDFAERVEEGAYVLLTVKFGLIKLINTKANLCDQLKNVDMECPIEKGKAVITKEINLPREIPPGKYSVTADVYTKDDEKITCLSATVVFGRRG